MGYHYAQLFETPRINNHSDTAPSDQILFGDDDSQSFQTLPKTITVPLHQVPILCQDLIHCNVNTVIEPIGQVRNYLHPKKLYLCFQMDGGNDHAAQCSKSHALTKAIGLIL